MRLLNFLLVGLLVLAGAPAFAQGDLRDRLSNLQRDAIAGDARALAEMTTLAEAGDATAQHWLGLTYSRMTRDESHPEAVGWYRKAAAQGHLFALSALAGCYADGRGVERDLERGDALMRAAADMGETFSQNRFGDLYRAPAGLPRDLAKTYGWLTIAIKSLPQSPSVSSEKSRGVMMETLERRRARLAQGLTDEQVAAAELMAAEWRRKSWDEVRRDIERWL